MLRLKLATIEPIPGSSVVEEALKFLKYSNYSHPRCNLLWINWLHNVCF